LEIGWISLPDIYRLLEDAPRLEEVLACISIGSPADQRPAKKLKHSKLQSVSLVFNDHNQFKISLLDLPMARHIFLGADLESKEELLPASRTRPRIPPTKIPSSLSTFKHLIHLYLGHPQLELHAGKQLVDALKFTPSLVKLCTTWINDAYINDLLSRLSTSTTLADSGDAASFFLPSLTMLQICNVPRFAFLHSHERSWPVTINRLARQRGVGSQRPAGTRTSLGSLPPITITLTFESSFHLLSMCLSPSWRGSALKSLNSACVEELLRSASSDDVDEMDMDRGVKVYCSLVYRIVSLVQNFKPPPTDQIDDLVSFSGIHFVV